MALSLRRRALRLERATWLSDSLLLLQGTGKPGLSTLELHATLGERVLAVNCSRFLYNVRGRLWRKADQLVVVRFPAGVSPRRQSPLHLGPPGRQPWFDGTELESASTDLSALLREELVGLERSVREQVQSFILAQAIQGLEEPGAFTLSKRLRMIRDALREPLPESVVQHEEGQVVQVESLVALDDRAFWISGWSRDEDGTFTDLVAVSPEGQRAQLADAFRIARPDVEDVWRGSGLRQGQKHGFMQFFEVPGSSPLEKGWIVELRDPRGAGVETDAPDVLRDTADIRETLFREFGVERPDREELRLKHLNPALMRLQQRLREFEAIESVFEYGTGNPDATVSVVVTLYQRLDLLNHQLLSFAQDPALCAADLIFVLDSPELAAPLSELASTLYALHQVPFRIVTLTRSAGFPNSNNLGASLARGRLLLLLNSDVFPEGPGWLERMASFYDATPNIGALGPKLLYEDDSIQHAGMYFEREAGTSLWRNQHYFKGLHRSFPPASVSRPVPAVTGASLMIDRSLYQELGGFRDIYMRGGYEDSDLCLRLIEKGLENWYLSDVELHHLEAQSFTVLENILLRACWLQTHLWDEGIQQLMARHAPLPASGVPAKTDDAGTDGERVEPVEESVPAEASAPLAS